MKKTLIIVGAVVGGLVVFVGAIIGLVFWLTGGAVRSGDAFLALLSEERIEEAYQSAATGLRSQQDAATFEAAVRAMGLTEYESASWSQRQIQNDRATLEGSVTTADGGRIPLTVELVSEADGWRVLALSSPAAGATIAGRESVPATPADGDLRALVDQTMVAFSDALQREDFGPFHQAISDQWKGQITPAGLEQAFRPLIDQGTDFANIRGLQPTLDGPAAFDENGLLVTSGFYPSEPYQAHFQLKYIYEAPGWKLFGIEVVPQAPGDTAAASLVDNASPATVQDAGPAYAVVENPALTGRLGRLVVAFPEGTSSNVLTDVRPAGGGETSASRYGGIMADLLAGAYDVEISEIQIPGVEVRAGHDTRMAVGVLRVAVGSGTLVEVLLGERVVASAYGNRDFGLPVGAYDVRVSGQRAPITIAEGQIVEF